MKLKIYAASTLKNFTDSIKSGFAEENLEITDSNSGFDWALVQIHGSPAAKQEDEEILLETRSLKVPKLYLIHRPDELLLNPNLLSFFETNNNVKLLFLGDLIFRFPFWEERRMHAKILPHPQLDLSMPLKDKKAIVGSYTSWGEMRDVNHYISLVELLKDSELFQFKIGGPGLNNKKIPKHIQISEEYFAPHFNVQLYHLFGKKRFAESSGSLHRGISIPIIFEANGAERLEGNRVIKIEADDDLKSIYYTKAAQEIKSMLNEGIDNILEFNLAMAKRNSISNFTNSIVKIFHSFE